MSDSILFLSDSYKVTHWPQYPPGTEKVYAYFESRGGLFEETVFFGLQYLLKKYLAGVTVTLQDINEAEVFWGQHFGQKLFNRAGWEHILYNCGGRLPVSIKAVPEGTVVPTRNVLMTVENTDPVVPWLTNFLETLLVQVWYPMTVATLSREMKKLILQYLRDTGTPSLIDFKLHDFGFRGVSSVDSAGIGGAAHLVNFLGTDTPRGIRFAMKYYGAAMCGFSIPASEHSTITSWGRDHEVDACENMLNQYPEGLVACVSDSFDIFKACSEIWGGKLRERILGRPGTLVVRPDSGEPTSIVPLVLETLGQKFGYKLNDKGFKVLPDQIRVIQGDGIDYKMTRRILEVLTARGWSTDNIAFGMGGALLQKLDRDTQKCAFKCAEITVKGEARPVFKDPITDPGKKSKAGRLKLVKEIDGVFMTIPQHVENEPFGQDYLVEVFRNGELLKEYNFDEIRARSKLT